MKLIGRVSVCRDLDSPDPALTKLLASEAKRRARQAAESPVLAVFNRPYFDSEVSQRQLRLFNSLAQSFGRAYGRQNVYSHDEWVQGVGTLRRLRLRVDFGGTTAELEFLEPGDGDRGSRGKGATGTTLRRIGTAKLSGPHEWADQPGEKLERQLESITRTLLRQAEESFRLHMQRVFELRVQYRNELIAAEETKRSDMERRQLEAAAERKSKIRQEIVDLANQHKLACEIRELVQLLGGHPDVAKTKSALFARWRDEATDLADSLDPLRRPFAELIPAFNSEPPGSGIR